MQTRALVPEDLQRNGHAERQSWCRAIAAHALATTRRSDPSKIVRSAWPGDTRALMIAKGATTPTTTAGLWQFNPVVAFRSLAPSSAALQLFERGLALSLAGVSTIRIPTVGNLPVQPIFLGEGQPAPVVQWPFGTITLGPACKIMLISAVTGELEDATPETASQVIGRVLSDVANRGIDATAFGTAPADAETPAGLLHNVVPVAAAAAGVDAMAEDLGNLMGAIGAAEIDSSGAVFVAGPREVTIIKTKVGPKFDYPILTTLGMPPKTVACFAPAGVASGYQDPPQIETGKEMVLHTEGATPLDISSPGSPPTVAAPVKSMWQSDIIAIRVRANLAFVAAIGASQVTTPVNW